MSFEPDLKIIDELVDRLLAPLYAGSDVCGGRDDGVLNDVPGAPPVHVFENVGLQATALAEAVRVLNEAARLTWSRTDAGQTITFPCNWADFVTHALAGAAANLGGIEPALAARPGSWEADGVRQLLTSTVGHDEPYLLEHRTEPVDITLYIDEIMVDLGVRGTYDDAQREMSRRSLEVGFQTTMSADAGPLAENTPEQEAQALALEEIAARLEEQRLRDWIAYAHLPGPTSRPRPGDAKDCECPSTSRSIWTVPTIRSDEAGLGPG